MKTILSALAAVLLLVLSTEARTQASSETNFDCEQLSTGAGAWAHYRDMGADLKKVLADIRRRARGAPEIRIVIVQREIVRVWTENLPMDEAVASLFKRCAAADGDMRGNPA